MKRVFVLLLAAQLLLGCAPQGTIEDPAPTAVPTTKEPVRPVYTNQPVEPKKEDWEAADDEGFEDAPEGVWQQPVTLRVNDDLQYLFDTATEGLLGVSYEPILYLGYCIFSGIEYCLLCSARPVVPEAVANYALVYLLEDLEGNAQVLNVQTCDLEVLAAPEGMVGGWSAPEGYAFSHESLTALDTAQEGFTQNERLTALALLGQQVVAGMNYAILCRGVGEIPGDDAPMEIVIVYADLQGNAQITQRYPFEE